MEGWANMELLIVVALASFPQEGACWIGGGLMWTVGRGGVWGAQGPSLHAGEPHWLFHVMLWMELALGSVLGLPHPPWREGT